jgi:hypothetical protein
LFVSLFPLDGRRRLGRDVVNDTVDVLDFVDDPVGDFLQYIERNSCPVGGHSIDGGYGPDAHSMGLSTSVTHDTDALHVRQRREILPDFAVKARFGNLVAQDRVGFAHDRKLLFRYFA